MERADTGQSGGPEKAGLRSGEHAESQCAQACQVGKKSAEELNGDVTGCWA